MGNPAGFFETYQAIATAIIGLTGIGLTIFFNNKWKSKEHNLNLKKDVYLAAVEAIHQAISSLSDLNNIELSDLEIHIEFRKYSPNISKALLIAKPKLRKALQNFNQEYNSIFLNLILTRQPLLQIKQNILTKESHVKKHYQEIASLLEIMKNYNLSIMTDQSKWEAIRKQYEFNSQQIETIQSKINELNIELTEQKIQFLQIYIEKIASLGKVLIPIEKAARKELGLKLDLQLEQERWTSEVKEMRAIIDNFINSARKSNTTENKIVEQPSKEDQN